MGSKTSSRLKVIDEQSSTQLIILVARGDPRGWVVSVGGRVALNSKKTGKRSCEGLDPYDRLAQTMNGAHLQRDVDFLTNTGHAYLIGEFAQ